MTALASGAPVGGHGRYLHLAAIGAAISFAGTAGLLARVADLRIAVFVLVTGVGLNLAIGRLWECMPSVIERPAHELPAAWTAVASWQLGVVLTANAWLGGGGPAWAQGLGPFLMLMATFLFVDHFGTAVHRAWRRALTPAAKRALAGLVPGAILLGVSCLLMGISFMPEGIASFRDVALSLFVFGALMPAGVASLSLRSPLEEAEAAAARPA